MNVTRRQAVIAGIVAVLVLAAAVTLLIASGHDHRAPHRLLVGDEGPSTTSSTAVTTTTDLPATTTTARAAVAPPPRRTPTTVGSVHGGIAFVTGNAATDGESISLVDADGTHVRHIADFDQARTASDPHGPWSGGEGFSGLAWSPSGDLIAAGRDGKYGGGLEVMRPDGSARRTLVFDSGVEHPSFSPDGRWLVFDNPGAHLATSGPGQVMVIGIDGKNEHPLGDGLAPGEPAWSPDGTLIAINNGDHLTLVRPDGSTVRQIAVPAGTFASSPAWSPDGRWISFTATATTSTPPQYTSDIYKVHSDGTGLTRVTDNHDLTAGAAWSPDGTRLVLSRASQTTDGSSTTAQLWTMNADGGDRRQLTTLAGGAGQAVWG